MRIAGICFLLLVGWLIVKGQSTGISSIDSLKSLLAQTDESDVEAIIDLQNRLSWEYHVIRLDSAFYYAAQANLQASKINYPKGIGRSFNLLSVIEHLQGNNSRGQEHNRLAFDKAQKAADSVLIGLILNDIGIEAAFSNQMDDALGYFHQALGIFNRHKHEGKVLVEYNLMHYHNQMNNSKMAQNYYDQITKPSNIPTSPIFSTLRELVILRQYLEEEKFDMLIQEAQIFLKKMETYRNHLDQLQCLQILSNAYMVQGNYARLERELKRMQTLIDEYGFLCFQPFVDRSFCNIYLQKNDFEKAINYALAAKSKIDSTQENYYRKVVQLNNVLAKAYAGIGQFEKAYPINLQSLKAKDSIFQTDQIHKIAELEVKYGLKLKEAENNKLRFRQLENTNTLQLQKRLLGAGSIILVLTLIIATLGYFSVKNKIRYSQDLKLEVSEKTKNLQAKNEELEGFAHIISHDLKEQIRSVVSFVKLLEKRFDSLTESQRQEYFSYVKKGALQMHYLLEDVMSFSMLNDKQIEKKKTIQLGSVVEKVKEVLSEKINERKAEITYDTNSQLMSSETSLFLILKNLIDNGLTYNESQTPKVYVHHKMEKDVHHIEVSDNGIGIPTAYKDRIFKMFYRLHDKNKYEGSGLGLSIVKKQVEQLQGSISVESSEKGTTFTVAIPS